MPELAKNFKIHSARLYFLYRYIAKLMIIFQFWQIKKYYYLQYVQNRQSAYNKQTEKISELPMAKYPHNKVDRTTFVDLIYVRTGTEILAR